MLTVLTHRYFAFHLHEGKLNSTEHVFRWDAKTWRILWPQAWRVSVGIFSIQIVLNFSSLLLVRSIDGARAAQLLFSLRFVRILDNFSTVPFYVYIPRMSRLRFEGRFREFWAIAERGMTVSLLVLGIPGIAIAILGPLILHAAGSKVSLVSAPVWLLLILGTLVMRYGALHLQLVTVANKVVWHVVASVSGLIFLCVLFFAISRLPPDFAYALAQLAAAAFFFAPYSLRHSYPVLDRQARRRDILIAGFNIGMVIVAIGAAFALGYG
jgi:O-antigen/teichoic acid export membrane protein